jgi:hypothetical protein
LIETGLTHIIGNQLIATLLINSLTLVCVSDLKSAIWTSLSYIGIITYSLYRQYNIFLLISKLSLLFITDLIRLVDSYDLLFRAAIIIFIMSPLTSILIFIGLGNYIQSMVINDTTVQHVIDASVLIWMIPAIIHILSPFLGLDDEWVINIMNITGYHRLWHLAYLITMIVTTFMDGLILGCH